jgi:hypothetical protein
MSSSNEEHWWNSLNYKEKYNFLKINYNIENDPTIIYLNFNELSKITNFIDYKKNVLDFKDE